MAFHELAGYEYMESWRGTKLSRKILIEENKFNTYFIYLLQPYSFCFLYDKHH